MKKIISISLFAFASLCASAQIKIYSGGNVAVGSTTVTPGQILHVMKDGGSSGTSLFVQDLNSTNAGGIYAGSYAGNAYLQPGASGKALTFWDYSAERMRIASGGYVGIGTTSPGYKLDVSGGDINVSSSGNGYRIQGNKIVWYNSTTTSNIFAGVDAGNSISSGANNSFFGYRTGYGITSGGSNVFSGYAAGYSSTSGNNNTYIGRNAGYSNTSGTQNVAIGNYAGDNPTSTTNNTYLGYNADDNADCSNCAAIGANAVAAASNKMYFGDANVTECRTTSWVSTSDGRFKINVNENVKGLEFINKLRPVTYNMDTKNLDGFLRQNMKQNTDSTGALPAAVIDFSYSMGITHSGFIAQEVEQALLETGFNSSILSVPTHANEPYALSYGEFVVPLVKAVQELSISFDNLRSASLNKQSSDNSDNIKPALINTQEKENSLLKQENSNMKKQLTEMQKQINELYSLLKK